MRTYTVPLAVAFVVAFALTSLAAEKPRPAKSDQNQPRKVWTNDDMDQLRSRGLISIVGQEAAPPAAQAPASQAETTLPVYASRLDDPEWYAEKAADLQAELDMREEALREQQTAIALAADQRITDPGVSMDKGSPGLTPAEGVANLQAQMQEIQSQLDALSDLARQHDIAPGVLRG
jgi:hypothetical protein